MAEQKEIDCSNTSLEDWRKHCHVLVKRVLGITDLLHPDDPYDVHESLENHYDDGDTPAVAIEELFRQELEDVPTRRHLLYSNDEDDEDDRVEDDTDEDDVEYMGDEEDGFDL